MRGSQWRSIVLVTSILGMTGVLHQTAGAVSMHEIRIHVVGIVGHKGYDDITKSVAGAAISVDEPGAPVLTDKDGFATVRSRNCEVRVTAPGFESVRQRLSPDDAGDACPNSAEVSLMSTSILMDPKLRRYIAVQVRDAATGRGLAGVTVAGVLRYEPSGSPRLSTSKITDAHGRARIEAYVRLDLTSNHWWQSLDRIDVSTAKPKYAPQIDTISQIGASEGLGTSVKSPLPVEVLLQRVKPRD